MTFKIGEGAHIITVTCYRVKCQNWLLLGLRHARHARRHRQHQHHLQCHQHLHQHQHTAQSAGPHQHTHQQPVVSQHHSPAHVCRHNADSDDEAEAKKKLSDCVLISVYVCRHCIADHADVCEDLCDEE